MLFKEINHEIKGMDAKDGIIEAYANVYNNIDSYKEMSMPGSFNKTVTEQFKRIRVLKNHRSTETLGVPKELNASDPYGLYTITQFNMKKDMAKDMFTDIQMKIENKQNADLSIGYELADFDTIKMNNETIQRNKEYRMYEYSFLDGWGANDLSIVTGVKSEDELIRDLSIRYNLNYSDSRLREIEKILKSLTKSPGTDTTIIDEPIKPKSIYSLINSK